jgi:anti-sigma factor RsiW
MSDDKARGTGNGAMRCRKVLELLPRFIEDDFSDDESREVSEHLATCEGCRAEWHAMRKLVDRLEETPVVGVPTSFKEAVMRLLPPKGSQEGGGT